MLQDLVRRHPFATQIGVTGRFVGVHGVVDELDGGDAALLFEERRAFVVELRLLVADVFAAFDFRGLRVELQDFGLVAFDFAHVLNTDREAADFDIRAGRAAIVSFVHVRDVLVGALVGDFHLFAKLVEREFGFRLRLQFFCGRNRNGAFHPLFQELILVFQRDVQIDGGGFRDSREILAFPEDRVTDGGDGRRVRRVNGMVLEVCGRQFVGGRDPVRRQFRLLRILGADIGNQHQTSEDAWNQQSF